MSVSRITLLLWLGTRRVSLLLLLPWLFMSSANNSHTDARMRVTGVVVAARKANMAMINALRGSGFTVYMAFLCGFGELGDAFPSSCQSTSCILRVLTGGRPLGWQLSLHGSFLALFLTSLTKVVSVHLLVRSSTVYATAHDTMLCRHTRSSQYGWLADVSSCACVQTRAWLRVLTLPRTLTVPSSGFMPLIWCAICLPRCINVYSQTFFS